MFDTPRNNELTQGTIFTCAAAENYPEQRVLGMIITARCDVAQDKAPIYNYIPVVSLIDWMLGDGAEIVLERYIADLQNSLKNTVVSAGLSETLLQSKTPQEIHDVHFTEKALLDKKWVPKCEAFITCASNHLNAKEVLANGNRNDRKLFLAKIPKFIDNIIKEIASNKIVGYYLLRQIPSIYDESLSDYVALLREIHHMPSYMAKKIARGISKEEYATLATNGNCPKFIDSDDYSLPLARLKSPWMEHLMQSLTLVFSRIGVDDVDYISVKKSLAPVGLE